MQFKYIAAALVAFTALPACTVNLNVNDTQFLGSSETETDRIRAVLTTQQAAWNAGDIDGFMQGYWQSPDLRFASGGTVTRGWQSTSDRYHTRYTDRAAMGVLNFAELEIVRIGDEDAIVYGRWALERERDTPSGLFTLLFRDIDGSWKIISDTTTSVK